MKIDLSFQQRKEQDLAFKVKRKSSKDLMLFPDSKKVCSKLMLMNDSTIFCLKMKDRPLITSVITSLMSPKSMSLSINSHHLMRLVAMKYNK
jgi:hypothetical protein